MFTYMMVYLLRERYNVDAYITENIGKHLAQYFQVLWVPMSLSKTTFVASKLKLATRVWVNFQLQRGNFVGWLLFSGNTRESSERKFKGYMLKDEKSWWVDKNQKSLSKNEESRCVGFLKKRRREERKFKRYLSPNGSFALVFYLKQWRMKLKKTLILNACKVRSPLFLILSWRPSGHFQMLIEISYAWVHPPAILF